MQWSDVEKFALIYTLKFAMLQSIYLLTLKLDNTCYHLAEFALENKISNQPGFGRQVHESRVCSFQTKVLRAYRRVSWCPLMQALRSAEAKCQQSVTKQTTPPYQFCSTGIESRWALIWLIQMGSPSVGKSFTQPVMIWFCLGIVRTPIGKKQCGPCWSDRAFPAIWMIVFLAKNY
jgi:hypothetical protein